jgi:palmitoyltransferase
MAEGRVYVELRYCRKCQNNQPLRAKHCRKCERCVSTFDHHCPWVGNCIGERNKKYFYTYIWFQLSLLAMMFYLGARLIVKDISVVFGYISVILSGIFLLFVANLIIFHSYTLSKNMTTWECLSWSKISYLKHWPR